MSKGGGGGAAAAIVLPFGNVASERSVGGFDFGIFLTSRWGAPKCSALLNMKTRLRDSSLWLEGQFTEPINNHLLLLVRFLGKNFINRVA